MVGTLERNMAPDLIEIEPRELKFTCEFLLEIVVVLLFDDF